MDDDEKLGKNDMAILYLQSATVAVEFNTTSEYFNLALFVLMDQQNIDQQQHQLFVGKLTQIIGYVLSERADERLKQLLRLL